MPTHRRPAALAWSSALALVATTATADAGPRRKRAQPAGPDLAAAVATGDAVAMCKAAIAAVAVADHARASLVLPACDVAIVADPTVAAGARTARIAVARAAERQSWSPVELAVRPAGAEARLAIDAFPGLPVTEGRHLLPSGTYRVTARNAHGEVGYGLTIADGSRALILIDLPTAPTSGGTNVLDFTEGEPAAPMAGPPPVIKRGSLLPERYRRGLARPTAQP